ncbi:biotin transport system substrate-specific component [Pedococcus dokdonensis]|uniref:Biotin transporter n=1 Tax=Pedococcus dokdonensis TaxID=443156 RepID=A0A1H0NT02_9MICO|nr:biotin transporter BioY [Pedococcus dokdonensis]SDO95520.1 biotin transport system substrate-specific component [Pedococcus dokdonensis]
MTAIAIPRKRVLADYVPAVAGIPASVGARVRDLALVAAGAGFIGLLAQWSVPLPGTPVPLTLGTFAVLLTGASLGGVRALLSVGTYLVAGGLGVNWFAGHREGWGGATFGYIIGYVVAATLVGWLAQRGGDRTVAKTVVTMVLGNLVIYAVGVAWLMNVTGLDLSAGLKAGMTPFLIGDAVKIAAAAGVLPAAWALVKRVEKR